MIKEPESSSDLIKFIEKDYILIYRYIYFRVGLHKEVAEDITQQVFLKLWKNRRSFDETKSSIKTWVFRIAKNLLIDTYRKKKLVQVELKDQSDTLDRSIDNVEDNLMIDYVLDKLGHLPSIYSDVLILRYIDGLEIPEISEIIHRSYNNTKVIIHRALNKLKKVINEQNK